MRNPYKLIIYINGKHDSNIPKVKNYCIALGIPYQEVNPAKDIVQGFQYKLPKEFPTYILTKDKEEIRRTNDMSTNLNIAAFFKGIR